MTLGRVVSLILSAFTLISLQAQPTGGRQRQVTSNLSGRPAQQVERYIEQYLKVFQLLDVTGREMPAILPGMQTSPFAALIEFSTNGVEQGELNVDIKYCTATHLQPGDVWSHVSCLPKAAEGGPAWVYLVYYDANAKKRHFQVTQYVEAEPGFDEDKIKIALPEEIIKSWPPLLGNALPNPTDVWEDPKKPMEAAVWAYDTLSERPEIIGQLPKQNSHGMIFNPRLNCTMASWPTVFQWISGDRLELLEEFKIDSGGDERNVLYVDNCNFTLIEGNLGALITKQSDPHQVAGIFHGMISRGAYWQTFLATLRGAAEKEKDTDKKREKEQILERLKQPHLYHFYYRSYNNKTWEIYPYKKAQAEKGLMGLGRPFRFLHSIFPIPDEEIPDNVRTIRVRTRKSKP